MALPQGQSPCLPLSTRIVGESIYSRGEKKDNGMCQYTRFGGTVIISVTPCTSELNVDVEASCQPNGD